MIKGKRAFLAGLLYSSQFYRGIKHLTPGNLVIFNYHRIRTSHQVGPVSNDFDDGVYGPTQEKFRTHMKWLKENSSILSEQDLIEHQLNKRELPKSSVMITFDDGYVDNADLALPILKEFKIPAIFFISTQAIENRELGWWDNLAYLIKQTKQEEIRLRGRTFNLRSNGPDRAPKDQVIDELQTWMRTLGTDTTKGLTREVSFACGVPLPDFETCSRELMTWDQIREVSESGVSIGSHTHTHRVLSTLKLSEQEEEFCTSKAILERELKKPIRSVAYPVGGYSDYHFETEAIAKNCGYELGFSFQTGANTLGSINSFGIKRISAEDTLPLTCAAITLPSIFARSRTGTAPKMAEPVQIEAIQPLVRHSTLFQKANVGLLIGSLVLESLISPRRGQSALASENSRPLNPMEEISAEDDPSLSSNPNIPISPGFLIRLNCPDDSKLNGDFRVSIDGKVYLPYDVIIKASGMKIKTFTDTLAKSYQPYFQGTPHLSASIKQRRYWVKVLGLVKNPGNYLIKDRTTLDEALALASVKTEDLPSGYARVGQGSRWHWVNMDDYLKGGSAHEIPAWRGGDQIIFQLERPEVDVTASENKDEPAGPSGKKVQVLGEIRNPGTVGFQNHADAYYYLIQRGGPTRDSDMTEVEQIRKNQKTGEHTRIKLGSAYDIKDVQEADILLIHPSRQSPFERKLQSASFIAAIISSVVLTVLVVNR